jgi:glycosyltransferase involved in cell wall biosynthesis
VVGAGPGLAELRRLAGELGLAGRVRWEGQLPQAELADRYRRAVALLMPGQDEGLGLAAVEAQLSATPVVAAASGGLLDVVTDGRTGLTFPPGQPAALARAVEAIVADPATATRLAEAGRKSAAARFGTAAAARTYAEIYATALRTRRHQQTTPS